MRAISAADDALFTAVGGRATFLRVDVQDSGLTYRDLTTYPGQNMVLSAQWGDSVDGQGQNGEVIVKREVEQLSLSPLMQASPLNLGFVFGGTYAPLLQVARGVRIYTADIPEGQQPGAADWRLMFQGFIDSVDPGQGETVKLEVSDQQAALRDTFIEAERVYSFATGANAVKGCRVWSQFTGIPQNDLMVPTDANRNGHFYKATTAGTVSTGGGEPPWPTVAGATVVDNGETWQEVGATAGMAIWSVGLAVATGDRIIPTALNANGHFYIAQGPGTTSATTEPTWPTGAGSTVVDNGITWKESGTIATAVETVMAQIAADNGQSVTVNIPGGSPGWLVKMFLQQRQSLWDAIRALADQIGWDLRYGFDAGSGTFKLNLQTPNRAKSTPDRTFGANEKWNVQQVAIDVAKVRNAVEVVFSASGSQDPSGNPLRISIIVTDPTSIAKYGRRYMLLAEASTANIDTSAEATAMATAAVSDLKEPSAEKKVDLPYFPFTELGDLYRFSPDGIYSDQNLDLAVVSYQHSVTSEGEASTTLTCRGKPSTGCDRWLHMSSVLNYDDVHQTSLVDSDQLKVTASSVVGGTLLAAQGPSTKRGLGQDYEWHIGTTSNFTPSQSTLLQSQGGNQVTAPHLIPGGTYYAKVVPVRRNASRIVRGVAGAAMAFVAGQASAQHIADQICLGDYPLNGGFETQVTGNTLPDHWETNGLGTVGVDYIVQNGAGVSGGKYMKVIGNAGYQPTLLSAVIPLINESGTEARAGGLYRMSVWVKPDAGNGAGGTLTVAAGFVDYTGNKGAGFLGAASGTIASNSHVGHWQKVELIFQIDTAMGGSNNNAMNAYVFFAPSLTAGMSYYVDEMRLQYLGTPWYAVGAADFTDNYEALPAFNNPGIVAWANFGNPYAPAAFRRDQFGRVYLRGLVKNGNPANSTIFTLPVGFRPASNKSLYIPTVSNNAFAVLEIQPGGAVVVQAGGNAAHVSLDNISFTTF